MEARQSDRMARVQSFLNHQWTYESDGVQWFDPDRDSLYPDRIRRRPPGASSGGLGSHLDVGTLDLWMTRPTSRRSGTCSTAPSSSTTRGTPPTAPSGPQYPSTTMCSAFRTFQGWTALSDMDHDQGVLHTVPIPEAMAYMMLRPLLADVPEDEMCGVTVGQVFPVNEQWHPLLVRAFAGIPDVQAGDTVWWHCRRDPRRRAGRGPAGLGQRHVHPGRALVPAQRGVRADASARRSWPARARATSPRSTTSAAGPTASRPTQLNETGRRGLGMA